MSMTQSPAPSHVAWHAADPATSRSLADARLQLHYAAQFAAALGISYLPAAADDSHTNLEWRADLRAIASRGVHGPLGTVTVAVRVPTLTILVLRNGEEAAAIPLRGRTIVSATEWVVQAIATEGLEPGRYTLRRHFELPGHAVATGAPFDAKPAALDQLARWLGNAADILGAHAARLEGASEVRLWPHHFDIATLISLAGGASTGAGLAMGDQYYAEPYFYVNAYPAPERSRLPLPLSGSGLWHTHEWTGAVLPVSRITADPSLQAEQADAFLDSALAACRTLTGN